MMVVGTDAGGNYHPQWRSNLALALKLSALLDRRNPGIVRPVHLRSERFNMDLTAGSLIVEVGAAGNTRQEALIALHALAEGVAELAKGSG
jgi:stage II sporulation protein P